MALAMLVGLAGLAGPAVAALDLPVTEQGARVTIRAQAGLEAQAARLAPRAEQHLLRIEADLKGLPLVDHVEIRLVKHSEDLAAAAPPGYGAPAWAAGTAYPDHGIVVVAARARDGRLLDMEQTLAHELAHMALDHALGVERVPRWLTEGFAYLHSSDASWARAQTLFGAVFRNAIIPIPELEHRFPAEENGVNLAYAESYDFVAFLARRGRWQDERDDGDPAAFRDFLANLAGGATLDAAALDAFGRSLAQLEAEWYETLRTRYLWYPVGALGALFWIAGAILLVLGWLRRRRQKRRRLAEMELEEAAYEAARLADRDLLN